VRWKGAKVDITQLAKLRWIEKRKTPDLCRILGMKRSTVRQRIRTLRKSGISSLNLSPEERLLIEKQISAEAAIYGDRYQ
jgi:biotin operon repressor